MLSRLFRRPSTPSPGATPATPRQFVGVGHSHLVALTEAEAARLALPGAAPSQITFVQMLAPEYTPTVLEDGALNPALQQAIAGPVTLFGCISGNEYHYLGLVDHPRPFDFVLPDRPDLPIRQDAEIIPAGLMRETMRSQVVGGVGVLRALAAASDRRAWIVQSPPPVPDDDYIRAHPIQFAEQVAQHGVAPASVRMKLWLLQSEVYRAACEELGLRYLDVPKAACDAAGFLLQPGWRQDPAHANSWYGQHVLQQIEALPQ